MADLQRQFEAKKSTTGSMYSGFGSDTASRSAPSSNFNGGGSTGGAGAGGTPGEDPNGVGRLTGETDQQYIARQTRIRDEAKARMAAKFGGGSMGGVGSGSGSGMRQPSSAGSLGEAPGIPGEDRNGIERLTGETDAQYVARQTRLREEAKARMAAKFGGGGMGGVGSSTSAPSSMRGIPPGPSSGNAPKFATPQRSFTPPGTKTPPRKMSSDDFFSSFGS